MHCVTFVLIEANNTDSVLVSVWLIIAPAATLNN